MKQLKYFIPAIIMMIVIFLFSHQPATASSAASGQLLTFIQNTFNITLTETLIRKSAHMFEYAILTLTFFYGFYHTKFFREQQYLLALMSCFLYACTDEIHQLFIEGRSGQISDVFIDTSGGAIMIICIIMIYFFIDKKNNRGI